MCPCCCNSFLGLLSLMRYCVVPFADFSLLVSKLKVIYLSERREKGLRMLYERFFVSGIILFAVRYNHTLQSKRVGFSVRGRGKIDRNSFRV